MLQTLKVIAITLAIFTADVACVKPVASIPSVAGTVEKANKVFLTWHTVKLSKEPIEMELVVITGHDVGLGRVYTTAKIYAAAEAYGLFRNSTEVGLALWEQYPVQPMSEWLIIATEPLTVSDDTRYMVYNHYDDDDRYLATSFGHLNDTWDPGTRWVFSRRKL